MKARLGAWIWLTIVVSLLSLGACRPIEYYLTQVYKVHGRVTIAGTNQPTPIGSVEVAVGSYHYSELTNYYGDYEMEMAEGTWTINISKEGFHPVTAEVTVGPSNPRERLDVEMVWIEPSTPIDLTDWWDLYFSIEGEEVGPVKFYIEQTGSALRCSHGLVGTVEGPAVIIQGELPWGYGVLTGPLSPDLIEGSVESDLDDVGFRLVRPSILPTGHLDVQGDVEDVPVLLDTEYAVAEGGQLETTYDHRLQLDPGSIIRGITLQTRTVFAKTLYVIADEEENEEDIEANAYIWSEGVDFWPIGGWVYLDTYTDTGMTGNFHLEFEGGDYLDGAFDVVFGANTGTISLTGFWQEADLAETSSSAGCEAVVSTSTEFDVVYQDHEVDLRMMFRVDGEISAGATYDISDGALADIQWQVPGPDGDVAYAEPSSGSFTIKAYTEDRIEGTFAFDQPTGPDGSFDVPFVPAPSSGRLSTSPDGSPGRQGSLC